MRLTNFAKITTVYNVTSRFNRGLNVEWIQLGSQVTTNLGIGG